MAIIALSNATVKVFESKSDPDKGKEGATKFHIGAVSARLIGHFRDKSIRYISDDKGEEVSTEFETNRFNGEIVRLGLQSIENFKDEAGNEIVLKRVKRNILGKSYDVLSDDIIDMLSLELVTEIANEIVSINVVKEDKKKKSGK